MLIMGILERIKSCELDALGFHLLLTYMFTSKGLILLPDFLLIKCMCLFWLLLVFWFQLMDFDHSSHQSDFSQASVVSLGPSLHSIQTPDGDEETVPLLIVNNVPNRPGQRQGSLLWRLHRFSGSSEV